MVEVLEGVLSEAILDELAADLGCDARLLRKHPFFRVLKGRVLLTYPLKTATLSPTFIQDTIEQIDPVGAQYYPVTDFHGSGIFYGAALKVNDATATVRRMKVTIDGVEMLNSSGSEGSVVPWHFGELIDGGDLQESGVDPIPTYSVHFRTSLLVTVMNTVEPAGGKALFGWCSHGEYP